MEISDLDDLLDRLAAGTLPIAEQQRLAQDLRLHPALRRQVRHRLQLTGQLAQAVRPVQRITLAKRRRRAPIRRPVLPQLAMAAGILLVVGLTTWLIAAAIPKQPVVETPEVVQQDGPFSLQDHAGTMTLADHSRVDLERGSSGTVLSATDDWLHTVRLESGAVHLKVAPGSDSLQVNTEPASVTARGSVTVRYLDVPMGSEPAIMVAVTQGKAQVNAVGQRRNIVQGECQVIAPGGLVMGRIVRIDTNSGHLVIESGNAKSHMNWNVSSARLPPIEAGGKPFALSQAHVGYNVRLRLDPSGAMVEHIEVPAQCFSATITGWNPSTRILTGLREHHAAAESWPLATGVVASTALLGKSMRLTLSPVTQRIERITASEHPNGERRPGAGVKGRK
ncbi:MAG: FecR domain-containing protein [Planctomycetota bacterium]